MSALVSAARVRIPPFLSSLKSDWSTPPPDTLQWPGTPELRARSHLGNTAGNLGSRHLAHSLSLSPVAWMTLWGAFSWWTVRY